MAVQDLTPQLRTRLSRVERVVGWFVMLATVLLLAGFGYYVYNIAQRKGWFLVKAKYFTLVDTAAGIHVGDQVKLMGFDVGWITDIETQPFNDPLFNVYVEFIVKEPYYGYIWTDSRAKVVTADLLGHRYIELTKGTNYAAEHLSYQFDEKTKQLTGVWERNQYAPIKPTSKFWVGADEAPALNERLERVAKQIEAALPNILNLTNQLSIVLSNSTRLTAHLDETTLELQPGLRNLTLLSAQLTNGPGALGEWLLPTNLNQQLSTTLVSAHASLQAAGNTLTNVDTNLVMLATGLNKTLINLASATSNLNAQVQANDKILSQLSAAVIHADEFVQGLKRHWLLRSAFKEKPTNQSPREVRPSTPKGSRSR